MSDLLKKLMDTTKHETVVLGPVQRHLLAQGEYDDGRRHDVIHPSELSKLDYCPRAIYYRLAGWEIPKSEHGFQLEVIFQQGHGYHDKWQNWLWDVGMLRGRFRCLSCMHGDWSKEDLDDPWYVTAPTYCPECGASRKHLQYGEVPIHLPKYRIHGHSDGDIDLGTDDDPLLEIKSIGEGTVRFEAPKLLAKHTHRIEIDGEDERSWIDWNKVWRDIKRPFKTHLRQGAIYCLAKGRSEMIYIYEFKPTGAMKEFRVKHDFSIIEDTLDEVLDILYALKKERPPDCSNGDACPYCKPYEELRDGAQDDGEEEAGPEDREDSGTGESEGEAGEEGDSAPVSSRRRRRSRTAGRQTRRPLGRRSDGGTEAPHAVDELPRDRGRSRRVRRDGGGSDSRSREGRDPDARGERRSQGQRHRPEGTRRVVRRRPRS